MTRHTISHTMRAVRGARQYERDTLLSVFLVAILVYTLIWHITPWVLFLCALAGLVPVLGGAWQSLRERQWASMDLLASIALVFSLASGEWVSALFIELMLAAARILDDVTKDRTEKSIRGLLKLRPEYAQVELNGVLEKKHLSQVHPGDIVVVGIGERISVDGTVLSGSAAIDESSLTGESLPVDKEEGSRVMSSTLVQSGGLRITTTHVGKDTTIERVIALVESARKEKPSAQTLGERFGKAYLIAIFVGSLVLYLVTRNLSLVLAVVLVVCADDIAIAIPIAYLRAISAAARIGVVVKGSKHLELLGKIDTIVFDKTGTLTVGKLMVVDVIPIGAHTVDEVLHAAQLAAVRSTHPISRALVVFASSRSVPEAAPETIEERGGKGVVARGGGHVILFGKQKLLDEEGIVCDSDIIEQTARHASQGKSIAYVAIDNTVAGFVTFSDHIKPNAPEALSALRQLGIRKIVMLSGDNEQATEAIALQLGIDEWHAELLPENKVDVIRVLQAQHPIAMVGDGVNDAGALSIAGVGIAMGGLGTEGAIESAQIVLMRDDLATLPKTVRIARMAYQVSIQDFWIWGATNIIGLILVFAGVIGPAGAAAYNFLSDFLPLFNSARVRVKRG